MIFNPTVIWFSLSEFNDMNTLRKRVKRFDEEVAPPIVNVSLAKEKNLRLKKFRQEEEENINMEK